MTVESQKTKLFNLEKNQKNKTKKTKNDLSILY